jgi:hypothetical protein
MRQQLRVAAPSGSLDFRVLRFLGSESGERQGVDRTGELLGQEAIDSALPSDAAFARESGRDDLDAKMRLAFGARPGMAGMAVRFVVNDEPERLEADGELGANALGNGHGSGTVKAARAPVKPPLQGSVVALVRPTPSPHT